jgi:zeta-carotene isomerase
MAAGEKIIGARAYRVLFALGSLPLAIVALVYFINHRYDGTPLWDVRGVEGVHSVMWLLNFVSFYFLYPSTFNILEVRPNPPPPPSVPGGLRTQLSNPPQATHRSRPFAPGTFVLLHSFFWQVAAVDEPKLHLWETGIMRITRHPQATGQALWCLAHTVWIGNSFMVVTSLGLMAHHVFGCWHGDQRLKNKYGEVREVSQPQSASSCMHERAQQGLKHTCSHTKLSPP